MRRLSWLAALFQLLLLSQAHAVLDPRVAASRELISSHIEYLSSDELTGRGIATRGIDLAADYIAQHFAEFGLIPGGDQGSYFQTFKISVRNLIPDRCYFVVEGMQRPCKLREDFTPLPLSSAGQFEGPVAFVGYGITNPDKDYDDYAGFDVRGKVAMMFRYEPESWKESDDAQWTAHAQFATKMSLAKKNGAIAVVIVNPPTSATDRLSRFRRGGSASDALPMFQITRDLADQLLLAGGLDTLDKIHARISEHHRPVHVHLVGVKLKGDPGLKVTNYPAKNVIGILPGAGPLANEYVVFGGHYDHLGNVPPRRRANLGATFDPADAQIHNGADDNASGTAAVIELARLYACGPALRRTLVFMAFSGEEVNLLGSAHFVEHPTIPLKDTVAMINLDMIGRLDDRPVQIFATGSAKEFDGWLGAHAESIQGLDVDLIRKMRYDSDHASFYRKDIPVLFAFSGMHGDYHRPTDDADKIDYDGMMRIVQLLRGVADDIIGSDTRPTFQKTDSNRTPSARPGLPVRMGFIPADHTASAKPGLGIADVIEDGPAAEAGIHRDDRILAINKQSVNNIEDYFEVIAAFKPGDEINVRLQRKDEELLLKVVLAGR